MSKTTFAVLNLLILIVRASSQQHQTELGPTEREDYALMFLSLFGSIVLAAAIRHVVRAFDIPIPYSVFCILTGAAWGVAALYSDWMKELTVLPKHMVSDQQYVYMPVLIFSIVFCIDVRAFMKSLPQILIIGGPVAILNALMTGSLMRQVIDPENWTPADSLIFGTLLLAIYPMDALRSLRVADIQTNHLRILLEGETIITACISCNLFEFLLTYLSGWIAHWYQLPMHILKELMIGVPISYIFGLFGCSLMRFAFNDVVGLMLITIAMCYNTFFFVQWMCNGGVVGTMIVGMMMGSERTSLSKEIDKIMKTLWRFIINVMNGLMFIYIGVLVPQLLLRDVYLREYSIMLATYLIMNISRFIAYFVFSPILSRIGYGMSFQNMIFCVWVGMKNPICMDMALYLMKENEGNEEKQRKARLFLLHAIMVYILTLFINGSTVNLLIRALGLSELSFARQVNMSNCIKDIHEARARTTAILKMDRFLSDANWPLVMEATALKHPYKKKNQDEIEKDRDKSDDAFFLTHKFTFCPECQKDVPNQPTPTELKEMTKEAKLRILKLRKTAYSRQYENGMMSKDAIRILHQAVEVATDSEELQIELDDLFTMFDKKGMLFIFLRNISKFCIRISHKTHQPPRKLWRRHFHILMITNNNGYLIVVCVVIISHLCLIIYHIIHAEISSYPESHMLDLFFLSCSVIFFLAYVIEFVLKIFALSWIYVCKHGVRNYFRSIWCILEFVIVCWNVVIVVTHLALMFSPLSATVLTALDLVFAAALLVRLTEVVTSLLKNYGFCHSLMPSFIKYLDSEIDKHRSMAFELGKSYIAAEEEILENLHRIVDHEQIRETIKRRIESDKLAITRRLGIAAKESPDVATTVKTKLAINTILNSMKQDAYEQKVSGWVDHSEYKQLMSSLAERLRFTASIKSVKPVPSKLIFREIAWMGEDDELIDFLYDNCLTRRFEPDEIVINEGEVADAVYILISGIMMSKYLPNALIINSLLENGILPIADYIFSMNYDEPKYDYILPGNSVGETSILNAKPYGCTITADTTSQMYVLKKSVLLQAFEMDSDPVRGLECRMWKIIYFRQAMIIMLNTPAYRSYTHDKIKYILERSFMPNLSNYKVFVVNEMMADILLIFGVAVDFNTRDVYTAPCYIPRAVKKLVLPKSSRIELTSDVETKLLILPAKDYDEYVIMLTEEQTCELVNDDSRNCLRHLLQSKVFDTTGTKATRHMTEIMTGLRKKLMRVDSSKNRRFIMPVESTASSAMPLPF